jgi:hypothetical protein
VRVLACDLGAFDPEERARYSALRAELGARRLGAREVAEGYEFSYPADAETILKLAEFVTLERRCCPFFDFALDIPAGDTAIRLTLGGDADVKEFLRASTA